ncbi:hypothetical protein PIB30_041821 [Stylosanthes scabra]|uniref:Uncharacterized protein n=1 Tax=Stylosanthes scabra TaxID=79078 RepID=A0ABU6QF29_9FABA|nr:hypothetical protein [Stylosanthes scabra]
MNSSEGRSRQQRVSQELATTLKISSARLGSFSQRVNAWANFGCQENGGCNCVCVRKENKREIRDKTDKKDARPWIKISCVPIITTNPKATVLGLWNMDKSFMFISLRTHSLWRKPGVYRRCQSRINRRVTHEATLYQTVAWVDQHRSISPKLLIFQSNGPSSLEHG